MLSIVIPIHNEENSILPLYDRLTSVLEQMQRPYEIIFVDDASTDRSFELLANLVETDGRLKVVRMKGGWIEQTAALSAELPRRSKERNQAMDGDLRNLFAGRRSDFCGRSDEEPITANRMAEDRKMNNPVVKN